MGNAFRKKKEEEEKALSAALRDLEAGKVDDSGSPDGGGPPGRPDRREAFRPAVRLRAVEQLFSDPALRAPFTRGLVFLHDKRPAADRLLELAKSHAIASFRTVPEPFDADATLDRIVASRPSRSSHPAVLVVTAHTDTIELPQLIARAAAAKHQKAGLWVRGYVDQLSTSLRYFDACFAFDMASHCFESLRSAIPLPRDFPSVLCDGLGEHGDGAELVFTYVSPRTRGATMPRLAINPSVLPMRYSDTVPARWSTG